MVVLYRYPDPPQSGKGDLGKPRDRTSSRPGTPVVVSIAAALGGVNWFTHVWAPRASRGSAHHPNRRPQQQEE